VISATSDPGLARLVVVGVVSGAFGAIVAELIRSRHDRAERLRERRLEAADGFLAIVLETLNVLTDLVHPGKSHSLETAQSLKGELSNRAGVVVTSLARVLLLFGASSATSKAASESVSHLSKGASAAHGDEFDEARRRVDLMNEELNRFVEAANKIISTRRVSLPWHRRSQPEAASTTASATGTETGTPPRP
jgi:hypothetical protein